MKHRKQIEQQETIKHRVDTKNNYNNQEGSSRSRSNSVQLTDLIDQEEEYLIKNFKDYYLNQEEHNNQLTAVLKKNQQQEEEQEEQLDNLPSNEINIINSDPLTTNINIYIINDNRGLNNNNSNSSNNNNYKMVDTNNTATTAAPADSNNANNPRKDHYSYSYTYKTADPESGIPGLSSVEVNESVTEEIGPDGSKIIRRHQQEKQINKITQVVTQRVIKRQYIDPQTGQIIEYDPNNELFANLPPETVFEERTIISDDNGNPPIVTTTTLSKTSNNSPKITTTTTNKLSDDLANQLNLKDSGALPSPSGGSNIYNTLTLTKQQQPPQSASFRIKSHPEDNQGYPEERNMDYDPDDCYPDDDSPYEGLIQPPQQQNHQQNQHQQRLSSGYNEGFDTLQHHTSSIHHKQRRGLITSDGSGQSTSGSSSSPVLFDQSNYQSQSTHYHSTKHNGNVAHQQPAAYATILPSSNVNQQQQQTPRSQYYATMTSKYNNYELADPYTVQQQQQQTLPPGHHVHHVHHHHHHLNNQQQQVIYQKASPLLNQSSNDYGKFYRFFAFS